MKRFLIPITMVMLACSSLHAQQWTPSIANRAIYSVVTNPLNPGTLYAGNMARMFFKSTDAGVTWEELTIGSVGGESRIVLLAVHPRDTTVVFAGGIGLAGLQRSTDAGYSWEPVLTTPDGYRFELGGSSALAFDPQHPDTAYCIRYQQGEVYWSTNAGATWELRSTIPDIESSDNLRAITVCPDSSNIVIVSGRRCRIHRSTDFGVTWTVHDSLNKTRDTDVGNFVWSPSNPAVLYATTQKSLFYNAQNCGLYKSTDRGSSWNLHALTDTSVYALLIHSTPKGEELYVGGNQIEYPADAAGKIKGDSIVVRSLAGLDTVYTDLSEIPWMESEIGDTVYNVWGFAVTHRNGFPVLIMATQGGLMESTHITDVADTRIFPGPQILRTGVDGFYAPDCTGNAMTYRVTDLLGCTVAAGTVAGGQYTEVPRTVGRPLFITLECSGINFNAVLR